MNVDLYTISGEKKGTTELPGTLFGGAVNNGLIHQVLLLQQSNRRRPIAHAKHRGEVQGSTRKLYQQKHTGRARRGSVRSPLLRGGGKSFGPRKERNFSVAMPQNMRHAALRSCLSLQAKNGVIMAIEALPELKKTKESTAFLKKISVDLGRFTLFVTAAKAEHFLRCTKNIRGCKTILSQYLNPEDVLKSRRVFFTLDALTHAEKLFGKAQEKAQKTQTIQKAQKKAAKSGRSSQSSQSSSSSTSS